MLAERYSKDVKGLNAIGVPSDAAVSARHL